MNSTAITEKEEVYLKHFFDSLQLLFIMIFQNHSQFVMLARSWIPKYSFENLFPAP